MIRQPITVTLSPILIRAVTSALRHNAAECSHPREWGLKHGCTACRALALWLNLTQQKGQNHIARRNNNIPVCNSAQHSINIPIPCLHKVCRILVILIYIFYYSKGMRNSGSAGCARQQLMIKI